MEYAYRADVWQAFYTALAGATAALIGLLFIALSLNLRAIVKVPTHIARARETFGGLLALLVLSILMLIPGQDRLLLGIEVFALNLVVTIIGVRQQLQTLGRLAPDKRMRWMLRITRIELGMLTGLIAGVSVVFGLFGGLFWLVPTVLIYLVWSLSNAWILMVRVAGEEEG